MNNYNQLLTKYSIKKGDKSTKHTNTRIGDKKLSLYGGNYHVPDEEYPNFIKSYYNDVIIGNKIEYFTEKQLDTGGPILIDLDFKFSYDLTTRLITNTHIKDILALYYEELKKMFQIDPEEPINVYVFLKDNVNRVEENKITKDGIHLIIAMQCNHNVQMILREKVMARIEEILDPLEFPLTNTWMTSLIREYQKVERIGNYMVQENQRMRTINWSNVTLSRKIHLMANSCIIQVILMII